MSSIVFYFSGTGNSLSVAKALADGEQPLNIAVSPIRTYEADTIGFVYPAYCGGAPRMLEDFIKNCEFRSEYIWAIVTHGGAPGNALGDAAELLRQKGLKLSYGKDIRLPDSVILFATPEPAKTELLDTESERVAEIKRAIDGRELREIKFSRWQKRFSRVTWFGFKYILGIRYKWATNDCLNCTQCIRQCPTQNITIKNNKASFGNNCEYCFGCIQYCPNNAIRFGIVKRSPKTQYNHPKILAKEMIKRNK